MNIKKVSEDFGGTKNQKIIDTSKSKNDLENFYNLFLENSLEIKQYLNNASEEQKKFWLEFFETKFKKEIDARFKPEPLPSEKKSNILILD